MCILLKTADLVLHDFQGKKKKKLKKKNITQSVLTWVNKYLTTHFICLLGLQICFCSEVRISNFNYTYLEA